MSDLRTAAQQALEFCEFLWREAVLNDYAEDKREATELALRAALAQEQAHGIIESEIKEDSHQQTLDDAMQQPRAMAQAYENGYKAGTAAEREAIMQFL